MYWTVFHILKYLDILTMVLVAGYACYEFFYAWLHDKDFEPQLVVKLLGVEISDEDKKRCHRLDFSEVIFGVFMLALVGVVYAFTWPVAVPMSITLVIAFYMRKKVRESKEKASE